MKTIQYFKRSFKANSLNIERYFILVDKIYHFSFLVQENGSFTFENEKECYISKTDIESSEQITEIAFLNIFANCNFQMQRFLNKLKAPL